MSAKANHTARPPKPVPPHLAEEMAGALLAIGRVESILRTQGLNWSDLAALVCPSPVQPGLPLGESSVVPLHPEEPPAVRWIQPGKLLELIAAVEHAAPPSLGERSKAFLRGLRGLADQHDLVRLSDKQDRWLRGLCQDAGIPEGAE